MATNAEMAKDILVATVAGRQAGCPDGKWLAEQYKLILKAVGEAAREEDLVQREFVRNLR